MAFRRLAARIQQRTEQFSLLLPQAMLLNILQSRLCVCSEQLRRIHQLKYGACKLSDRLVIGVRIDQPSAPVLQDFSGALVIERYSWQAAGQRFEQHVTGGILNAGEDEKVGALVERLDLGERQRAEQLDFAGQP